MHLLPFAREVLRSDEPVEAVQARLVPLVATARWGLTPTPEPFRGVIQGRRFKIVRRIRGRNSFVPVIAGELAPAAGGTEVRLTFRIGWPVAVFMALWCGFPLAMLAGILSQPEAVEPPALIFPLVFLTFGGALTLLGFTPEVKRARALLCEGLRCREAAAGNRLVRG